MLTRRSLVSLLCALERQREPRAERTLGAVGSLFVHMLRTQGDYIVLTLLRFHICRNLY